MEKLNYSRINWKDRVLTDAGEVKEEGTALNADNLNRMDEMIGKLVNRVNELEEKVQKT
ncbi:hypothetical protein [Clostridium formicaceticum]|uniref:Uncharacterized protein n=1 Tax=Clostridium formicaceticum TaxID=1497 RepID=A0AAC9RKI3_9CLOT|nr:hypothetical protein [Clostridium formicaceticum]ARE87242.1 hypothetical protein CLFO_16410 [Clostridium formicaceticum]